MKKIIADLNKKTVNEIEKDIRSLREEIAKLRLEVKVNPVKDSNLLVKKKKKLAVLLTILTEKSNQ